MIINKSIKIALFMLLTITTVLSVGWYMSQSQTRAAESNVEKELPISIQEQSVNQAGPQPSTQDMHTQTVNGIPVTLISVKIISTGIQVDICYSTPDGGDWYQLPGNLFYGEYVIPPDEAEIISDQRPMV